MATKKVPYQYYLKIDKSSNPKRSGKYSVSKHLRGIKLHILPWSEKVGNLTSKKLLSQCSLEYMGEVETIEVDGKKKIILHQPVESEE